MRFGADIVVHDELETKPEHIQAELQAGLRVVVFEDTGPGQERAHKVFNALYPADETRPEAGRYFGPAAYCLRDEFRHARRADFCEQPRAVLLSFGGTDPSNLTFRVLGVLAKLETPPIIVVAGRGLARFDELSRVVEDLRRQGREIELHRDVPMMSELMARADVAFSSAGRTLYELAHMGVPTVVLAQNDNEMKHTFASIENGFLSLGLGSAISDAAIEGAFESVLQSPQLRAALRDRMLRIDLASGRDLVIREILEA